MRASSDSLRASKRGRLAHLRPVIMSKLRRDEWFMMHLSHGDGIRLLWVDAAWIEAFMASASSTYGLQIVPEPDSRIVQDPRLAHDPG
ncbi:DUF7882 family protein [Microbacterium arborescens]